jgi:excisionase family DNA binding protein
MCTGAGSCSAPNYPGTLDCQSNSPERNEEIQMVKPYCAQTVPMKRLYSIKELAAEIGATQWYWRSQIWDGLLPYVQVGRKMLVDRVDIDAFIQNQKKTERKIP